MRRIEELEERLAQVEKERDGVKEMFRKEVERLEREIKKSDENGEVDLSKERAAIKERAMAVKKRQKELVQLQKKLKEHSAKVKQQKEMVASKRKSSLRNERRSRRRKLLLNCAFKSWNSQL